MAAGEFSLIITFCPPEQLKEATPISPRSDIYSLGALAYFLVTGRPPFQSTEAAEIVASLLRDPVTPPTALRADLPTDLEQVILRCLKKEPESRFPSMKSLQQALGSCADVHSWTQEMARDWWDSVD